MRLTGEQWKGILELAEQQRELQKQVAQTAVQVDSEMVQTAKALQKIAEEQQDLARFLRGDVARETLRAAQMINSMPVKEYAAAAKYAQQPAISPESIRAVQKIAVQQQNAINNLVNNQAFLSAISQWQELADTVESLRKAALLSHYQYPTYSESDLKEFESSHATSSLYDQTIDPYGPVRDDIYEIQWLLAQYLYVATVDQGDVELTEMQKKGIRTGLAVMVGLAAGLPVGLVFGIIGIPVGITSAGVASQQLEDVYDIKQRQQLPDDDTE